MDRDFTERTKMVTCTFCQQPRIDTYFYVVEIDGKVFCENRFRCYNAYVRNGRKPKAVKATKTRGIVYMR